MLFDYNFKFYNFRILLYVAALNIIGLMSIWSATNQNTSMLGKQLIGIGVGLSLALVLSFIDYHKVLSIFYVIYAGCNILLLAVLIFGKNVNNATRWIVIPGIGQLQPSEFVKIGLIIFFSWYFNKYQEKIDEVSVIGIALLLFAVPAILILKEPDLSTTLVIVIVIASMVFAAGISYRWIFGTLAVITPLGALFIYLLQYEKIPFLKAYQARRILAWVSPEKYADAFYQQENSIIAIGSGMLHGKGWNNTSIASVKNGNFLVEEQTDFIFAIIGEEFGFIGSIVLIAIYALLVYECLAMASKAKDTAGRLICTGMATLIAFQGFSNIAVATGIFPNTGLPLPFVSSGVSSLISIYIGIGLILNIGLQRRLSN